MRAEQSLAAYIAFLQANAAWFVALFVSALLGAQLERALARRHRVRRRSPFRQLLRKRPAAAAQAVPFDAAQQLRAVERAPFTARPVLNRGESRLFDVLERACAAETPGWRVLAQVSLGEILTSPDEEAYRAINSKRVDLLLVGIDSRPLHAIELQGSGHHLGPAATRDAIKKEALRRAGIGYREVTPGDTPADIRALVARLANRRAAAA